MRRGAWIGWLLTLALAPVYTQATSRWIEKVESAQARQAMSLAEQGHLEAAAAAADFALAQESGSAEATLAAAWVMSRAGFEGDAQSLAALAGDEEGKGPALLPKRLRAKPLPRRGPGKPEVTPALLKEFDHAQALLAQGRHLEAALLSRRLLQRYPGWDLPYLYYMEAMKQLGARKRALQACERALELAQQRPRPLLEGHLREQARLLRADRVDAEASSNPSVKAFAPLASGYLGFAGGAIQFGGVSPTASANLRVGRLLESGLDVSANLSWQTQAGLGLGAVVMQRMPLGAMAASARSSLNLGGFMNLSPAEGSLGTQYGLFAGVSLYSSSQSSTDFNMTLDSNGGIGLTLGLTTFLGP